VALAALIAIVSITVAYAVVRTAMERAQFRVPQNTSNSANATSVSDSPNTTPKRPVYAYSVIPGGAYDGNELRSAMEHDSVVAAQYSNVDPALIRTETVEHDRSVYVSYRRVGKIFWTKNRVLLREGETILTGGNRQIRARCGNGISDSAQSPTSDDEAPCRPVRLGCLSLRPHPHLHRRRRLHLRPRLPVSTNLQRLPDSGCRRDPRKLLREGLCQWLAQRHLG
jgi:hypothetical protein